jgi:hypothetical protein
VIAYGATNQQRREDDAVQPQRLRIPVTAVPLIKRPGSSELRPPT